VKDFEQEEAGPQAPVDIFGPGVHGDPYAVYREVRSRCPVSFNEGTGTYALTTYEDISRVLRDPVTFSNGEGGVDGPRNDYGGSALGASNLILAGDDDPRHKYLRQILGRAFSPARIRNLREVIVEIVTSLVDDIPVGETFDATASLANPLPLRVMARFMGFPENDASDVIGWVVGILIQAPADANKAQSSFDGYFRDALAEKLARPDEDALSVIAAAVADSGKDFSEEDALRSCFTFLLAGLETTRSQITNMLAIMADRPEVWSRLRRDPILVPTAVEETLRFEGPVHQIIKRVASDVLIGEVSIPAGSHVSLALAAGNRDSSAFSDADDYELDRSDARHLSFGHGTHFCIGAPLARCERVTLLEVLTGRFERLEGSGERVLSPHNGRGRGYQQLPLRVFAPVARD
jgi:cytochrome P450